MRKNFGPLGKSMIMNQGQKKFYWKVQLCVPKIKLQKFRLSKENSKPSI